MGLIISTPVEYFKCVAQVNTGQHISYSQVVSEVGVTGIYKGFWATMWRDVPSWAVYFWAYEHYKNKYTTAENSDNRQNYYKNLLTTMIIGGIAGQLSWIVSYPFDQIKTVIQTSQEKLTIK